MKRSKMDLTDDLKNEAFKDITKISEEKLNRQSYYCSQSIEEWKDALYNAYIGGEKRPDVIIVALKRNGECYEGTIYK